MTPNTPTSSSSSVPAGLGTKVGFGLGVPAAIAGAVTAFILGDRSEYTIGVLVATGLGGLLLAVTIGGRMLQAALREHGAGDVADVIDDALSAATSAHDLALKASARAEDATRRATDVAKELRSDQRSRSGDDQVEDGAPTELRSFGGRAIAGEAVFGSAGQWIAPAIAGDLALDPHDDVVDEPDDRREPELVEPIAAPAGRRLDAPPVPDEGDTNPDDVTPEEAGR